MRGGLALLALLVLFLSPLGCSRRVRANPFDPANPETRGRPAGFVALAGDGVVTLRWSAATGAGLEGFRLYRRRANESGFTPISSVLGASTMSFVDSDVLNGADQHYRLFYVFLDDRAGLPAEDVATPGPLKVWVADVAGGRVTRLTPDARHIVASDESFSGPSHLAFDDLTGILWVSDSFAGDIVLVQASTGGRRVVGGATSPGAIALDPARSEGWVCDPSGDVVHHLDESGAQVPPQLGLLQDPLAAAVDPFDGAIWVCENMGNRVRRFSRAGSSLVSWPTGHPSRVAVDSLTRDAWVTSLDQGRVFRLDPSGVPQDTVAVARAPVGVAVDPRRGRIWIADPGGGQVFALARDGTVVSHTPGIAGVTEVDVDLATGEAWATSPAFGEVVRISVTGAIVRRLSGFAEPYGIALSGKR